ncbi:hypothetical protein [Mycobacteroides abscessus]|uniref:hypothetical protein n=1 Tax=Mycobacteroides abscessus TaxID=36809 RepID=UPI000C257257|nr:hypothetical protein [Mycobacteroides abscessus]
MRYGDVEEPDMLDEVWLKRTNWGHASLDAGAVASILGIAEGTIRQYAAKGVEGFPMPALREAGRNYWTPAQIFHLILTSRRQLINRVPRLYSERTAIAPAQFLFGERRHVLRSTGGSMGQQTVNFAVHYWQPADSRGPIAIAYPGVGSGGSEWKYAPALLNQMPNVSAVAVVTDEMSIARGQAGWQVAVGVVERGDPPLKELGIPSPVKNSDGTPLVAEWGWFALANLLRVDLPWWASLLRDVDQMAAWFPGAPRQRIRPHTASLNETNLMGLVGQVPDAYQARVGKLAAELHRHLEGDDLQVLPPEVLESPGITAAAEPLYRLTQMPDAPGLDALRWLLHCPVRDTAVADRAAQALESVPDIGRVIANTIAIDPAHHGPLAQEWICELEPITGERATELGFAVARRGGEGPSQTILGHYIHPRTPHVWVVATADGGYLYTVGKQVPARGRLEEFELYYASGFFRDSQGQVWPLPVRGHYCGYNSGYDGSGPEDLHTAVTVLRADAGADLHRSQASQDPDDLLWRHIRRHRPPLVVLSAQLDEFSSSVHREVTADNSTARNTH